MVDMDLIKSTINDAQHESDSHIVGLMKGLVAGMVAAGIEERKAFDIVMLPGNRFFSLHEYHTLVTDRQSFQEI